MNTRRDSVLRLLGVERLQRRDAAAVTTGAAGALAMTGATAGPDQASAAGAGATAVAAQARQALAPPVDPATATLDWESLARAVAACTYCGLHATRTQTVFGVGDRAAAWLVVGEAPGADEDLKGEPFVGRAGQLLNSMLRAAGLAREQVYIANVLKCRPPQNREPSPQEAGCCLPYLHRQIALLQPRIILCVGRIAAQNLLGVDTPLAKLRGRVHALAPLATPVVVTYHPAYLLRSPGEKRKAWVDLEFALEVAHGRSA